MSIIKAYRLYKSYGSLAVLSDVSFSLEREQKVALIGRNGTGKTTLLKIIAGFEAQDSGKIEIPAGTCVGYLPQDTSLSEDKPIMDYLRNKSGISALENELEELSVDLGDPTKAKRYIEVHTRFKYLDGYSFTHRAEIILAGFGLDGVKLDQSLLNLSSGQKTKVVLAGILLKRADLLLLDEPTNNLDLPALIWLEDFLRKSNASCIIVSHDRKFLDRVADKIFKLDWRTCSLAITKGTYTDYLKMMAKHAASQRGKYRIQQEEINRLNERAREKRADAIRGSRWTGRDNDKFLKGFKRDQAAKSSKIAKSIKKRIEQMNKIEKPVDKKSLKVLLNARVNSGILDVEVSNVVTGYPGSFLIGPLSLEIRYGSRVGIVGLNGAGKSTLLKTITGEIEPLNGTVRIGSGIKIGNMMQEHEILPRGQILLSFFRSDQA
jgi:ATPase subunit of ABC transporter with duplicated ATPase domains